MITGKVLSITVMIWLQVLVLPEASVARQVRVIVPVPLHPPNEFTSVEVIVDVEQTSVAVAVPVAAGNVLVLHCRVTFAGHVITGGTLSDTVTVNVQVAVLPQPSVAVAVTVVVPVENVLPDAGL